MTWRLLAGWKLGLLAQLSAIGLLLTSAWLISRAAEHPPVLYLMVAIVSVRAFGIARAVLRYCERLLTHDAAFRIMNERRLALYTVLAAAAPTGMPRGRRGDVVNRVVRDVDAYQDQLLRVRIPRSIAVVSCLLVVGLVGFIDVPTAIVMFIAVGLLLVLIPVLARLGDSSADQGTAALRGLLAAEVAQAIASAPDLIVCGAASSIRENVRRIDLALAHSQRRFAWINGLSSAIVMVATGAVVVAAARFGVIAVADGSLARVLLAVTVLAPLALAEPLDQLGPIAQTALRVRESLARVAELERVRPPIAGPAARVTMPVRADLSVEALCVGWPEGAVAEPLTFALEEGGVVAITGPSGAGKSTLAATLLGLIPPRDGQAFLGETDMRCLSGDDLRTRIGLMEQDSHIFDTSIRENLRIGDPSADDAGLDRALSTAGLGGFLCALPTGLDTLVGENGARLSGGERQRLILARLLLADRKILILDEPTEHLDDETAAALLDDILDLAPLHSVILISHSQAVLDRVGHVVRVGQPAYVTS